MLEQKILHKMCSLLQNILYEGAGHLFGRVALLAKTAISNIGKKLRMRTIRQWRAMVKLIELGGALDPRADGVPG